jgi:hypothetical protein
MGLAGGNTAVVLFWNEQQSAAAVLERGEFVICNNYKSQIANP